MGKVTPLPSPARAYHCPPIISPETALTSHNPCSTIHEQIQQLYRNAEATPLPNSARAYHFPPIISPQTALTSHTPRSTLHEQIQQLYRTAELPSIYRSRPFGVSAEGSNVDKISFGDSDDTSLEVFNTGINIADWSPDLDIDNPLYWPLKKKLLNMTCIFLMCIVS